WRGLREADARRVAVRLASGGQRSEWACLECAAQRRAAAPSAGGQCAAGGTQGHLERAEAAAGGPQGVTISALPGGAGPMSRTYRFSFIMQQVLGHITTYRNLRQFVDQESGVVPTWTEVTYHEPGRWIERLPVVPAGVKGVARGALQVRGGLRETYDAVLFNSSSLCLFVRGSMRRVPSVIVTDVTPHQYDLMGEFYNHAASENAAIAAYKHRVNVDVYRSARLIVPWSQWVKGSLMRDYGVPEEKIVVLPPGVDTERWSPPPEGQREAQQGLPRILFVGGDFE